MAITAEDNITFTVTPELNKKQLEADLAALQKQLIDLDKKIAQTNKERGKFNNKSQVQQLSNLNRIRALIVRTNNDIRTKQGLLQKINTFEKQNLSITNTEHATRQRTLDTERAITKERLKQSQSKSRRNVNETENGTAGFYDTMFGGAGTSFGHKIATTAQYAVAGTALYKLAAAFGEATTATMAFDAVQYKLRFVLGASSMEADKLSKTFQDLSVQYGSEVTQINEVAISLGRAGIANDKLAQSTKEVIRLALITGDSLADTTSVVVSFEQVFGSAYKSTTQLADALAWTANASRLSTKDLGTLSNYALSAAKTTGMTANSVLALSAAFSNAGVNASTIGTQIRKLGNMMKQSTQGVQTFFQTMGQSQGKLLNEFQNGNSTKAFKTLVNDIANMSQEQYNAATANLNILERDAVDKIRSTHTEILSNLDTLNSSAIDGTTEAADQIALSYEQTIARIKNAFFSFASRKGKNLLDGMFGGRTNKDITELIDNLGKLGHTLYVGTAALVAYKLAIREYNAGLNLTIPSVTRLQRQLKVLNLTVLKNPFMLAAGAIAAVTAAMVESYSIMSEKEQQRQALLEKATENYNKLQKAAEAANKAMYGDVQAAASTYKQKIEETTKAVEQLTKARNVAHATGNIKAEQAYTKALSLQIENLAQVKAQYAGIATAMQKQNKVNFSFIDPSQLKVISEIQDNISKMTGDKQLAAEREFIKMLNTRITKQKEYIKDNTDMKIAGVDTKDARGSLSKLLYLQDKITHDMALSNYERGKELAVIKDQITFFKTLIDLEGTKLAAQKRQVEINKKLHQSKLNLYQTQSMADAKARTAGQYQSNVYAEQINALSTQYDQISSITDEKDRQLALDKLDAKIANTAAKYATAKAKEERKATLDKFNLEYKLGELDTQRNDTFQNSINKHKEKITFLKQELEKTKEIGNEEDRKNKRSSIQIALRKEEVAVQQAKEKQGYMDIENILNNIMSQTESNFADFFDYASKGFLDFQKLANDILHEIYMQMIKMQVAKPLSEGLGAAASAFGSWVMSAQGNIIQSPQLSSYSNTVVDRPTAFAFASGGVPNIGVMGEKNGGSPEAIMPLTRTPNGDLGVKTSGTQNVKIEIVNESGQKLQVKESKVQQDMSGMVIAVVLDAIATNRSGMRTAVRGQ